MSRWIQAKVDFDMASDEFSLDSCHEVATVVAKMAGKVAHEAYSREKVFESKISSSDLVTETDKKVEDIIMLELRREFPNHKFIGEESVFDGSDCSLTSEPTWMVDPIDGTMNFIHRIPHSAVSIGLCVDKKPVVGVVYNYATDELFAAAQGKGATLNGKPIHVSGCNRLTDAVCLSEAGCQREEKFLKPRLESWRRLLVDPEPVRGFRSFGSAALNLCMIACGSADAYYEYGIHCWDIAAGVVIVQEAGGFVSDPRGESLNVMRRGILASSCPQVALKIAEKVVETVDHYPPDGH